MKMYEYTILTASGKYFDLQNPKPEDITIDDIAIALARECRYANGCNVFYSVADHVLNGREHIDQKLVKYWDLHDAEEYILGDVPTPLKKLLGNEWTKIQQRVHKAICERFNLDPTFPLQVKTNDHRMLLAEREVLFDKQHLTRDWNIDKMEHNIDYEHVDIIIRPIWRAHEELLKILKQYE